MNIFVEALMSSLKDLGRTHPLATATVGATGGLGGAFLAWIDEASRILGFVSALFGSLVAIIAFILALPKLLRLLQNWRSRGLKNADRDSAPPFPPVKGP